MSKNKRPVTANCRYLDHQRRVTIPAFVLEKAGIPAGCILEFEIQNGCVVAKPVVGITIPDHTTPGALVKKGR